MKKLTIKDLTDDHINDIYSILYGKVNLIAKKIEWVTEKDFVVVTFKTKECEFDDRYDTIDFGMTIDEDLVICHTWWYNNGSGHATVPQHIRNHHAITKYLITYGFDV